MKTIVLAIVAFCSLPFFLVGLYDAYHNIHEISIFIQTEGTVVENSFVTIVEDGNGVGSYLPQVEFALPDGNKIRFTDKVGSLPPDYEIGETVQIIYQPENPANACINSWKRIWLAPVILMSVGILPLIICFVILHRLKI